MSKTLQNFIFLAIGAVATITFDYALFHAGIKESSIGKHLLEIKHFSNGSLPYINPILDCEIDSSNVSSDLFPFQSLIENKLNSDTQSGRISEGSVYFRDLNNGPWFGVNIEEKYIPASLLKLPLAIAYYKLSETDPSISKKEVVFKNLESGANLLIQKVKPEENLEVGKTYQIKNLVNRMLVYSDNQAADLVFENVGSELVIDVFKNLGVKYEKKNNVNFQISVREFAIFFRILYNASYLDKKNSNEILQTLLNSNFEEGIAKPLIKEGVPVAHKFGETSDSPGTYQLHDCGVVYYPGHPYVLCVFTEGKDFEKLTKTIQEISSLVLSEIKRQESSFSI